MYVNLSKWIQEIEEYMQRTTVEYLKTDSRLHNVKCYNICIMYSIAYSIHICILASLNALSEYIT